MHNLGFTYSQLGKHAEAEKSTACVFEQRFSTRGVVLGCTMLLGMKPGYV
jgi:hypothetical protein